MIRCNYDQQRDACKCGEPALVSAGGARGVEACRQLRTRGKQHIDAPADGAVSECLDKMALSDSDLADDEHRGVFGDIATGRQIVHQVAIEFGQPIEVELACISATAWPLRMY